MDYIIDQGNSKTPNQIKDCSARTKPNRISSNLLKGF